MNIICDRNRVKVGVIAIAYSTMKYKIVFSIPIHERLDVVLDQIINITFFNPESCIVLHISQTANFNDSCVNYKKFNEILKQYPQVYINPNRLRTGAYDIIQTHLSNFCYISSAADFDYFCMMSSNELFIKSGLYDYINKYDCGLSLDPITPKWDSGQYSTEDSEFINEINKYPNGQGRKSQVEGTFYKKELYGRLCTIINGFYDYKTMKQAYAREEIFFSTFIYCFLKNGEKINILKDGFYTWCNWYNRSRYLMVSINDVNKCIKDSRFFAVKRINRAINDYVRNYVMWKAGYFEVEKQFIPDLKLYTMREYSKQESDFRKQVFRNRLYNIWIDIKIFIKQLVSPLL